MSRGNAHPLLGLAAVSIGASIAPMDFAVNVAFPAITAAFALNVEDIRWVVIAYVVTYASLMLAFGKLGDVVGYRRVFHAGLVMGIVAFVACGLAPSYAWLLTARILQGIATALVLSCAPALAVALGGHGHRTWALSRYAMITALAAIAGPLIGGASLQWLDWPGVFWFRVPVAAAALLMLWRVPQQADPAPRSMSATGAMLLAAGLALILLGCALWPGAGSAIWPSAFSAAGAGVLFVFVWHERTSTAPMLPRAALGDRAFLLFNVTSVAVHFVGFAVPLLTPFYLARVGEFSAVAMGLLLAAAALGMFMGSAAAPRLIRVVGQHRAALCALGMVVLAQWSIGMWPLTPAMPQLLMLVAGLLLHGVGIGLFQVSYTDSVLAALPARDHGVAGSLTMLTRTIGVTLSAVALSSAFRLLEAGHLADGRGGTDAFLAAFQTVFFYSGLLLALFALVSWLARTKS